MKVGLNNFPFDIHKAIQAVGVLHAAEGVKDVSYYRLLKLLYIADREFLLETGRPIVGGRNVAMDSGPLSSPIYSLINGEHEDTPEWQKTFATNKRYLTLLGNPGTDEMSKKEIRKLHQVSERLADRDNEELKAIVHGFGEYRQHYEAGTSKDIPLDSALAALGMDDKKEAVHADIQRLAAWKQLVGE